MRHPTDGTLRRLVDEPAGVADADREHVAGCQACLSRLAAAREDAAVAGAALEVQVTADAESGWRRLSSAAGGTRRARTAPPRWRSALRSPAIAAVGVVALLTGASAMAAADWLQVFRTERIAPITVSQADLVELPDLSAYGEVQAVARPDVREVADAAAARRETGLTVPRVAELPGGVTRDPTFQVVDRVSATFTFSAEEAARAAGEEPPPPAGLDGARFRMVAGPGLAAIWPGASGLPALVVARAVAPTVHSSGTGFDTARDYLLSLPGLPDELASQLRRLSGDGRTLPLPVDADELTSSAADVRGTPATVLTARDGSMAGVVWVRDGVVTAVAGSLSDDEVLSVARGLRESG